MIGFTFLGMMVERNCGRETLANLYLGGALMGGLTGYYFNIHKQGAF